MSTNGPGPTGPAAYRRTGDDARGTSLVMLQIVSEVAILAVGAFGPRPRRAKGVRRVVGLVAGTCGVAAIIGARRDLGAAFSVFPGPRAGVPVAEQGAYRLVRHPMYTGLLAQAAAICAAGSTWALVPTAALAVILDRKATEEEARLERAHPAFAAYRDRTRWRFVPGVR